MLDSKNLSKLTGIMDFSTSDSLYCNSDEEIPPRQLQILFLSHMF